MGNSAISKLIDEGTIQFGPMMDVSLLFKAFVMFPLISLGALHREGFCFSSKDDLMKVSKEAHVMFQAERVDNVYIAKFGGYSW